MKGLGFKGLGIQGLGVSARGRAASFEVFGFDFLDVSFPTRFRGFELCVLSMRFKAYCCLFLNWLLAIRVFVRGLKVFEVRAARLGV